MISSNMLYNNKCIILEHMLVFHAVKNHLGDILFHITCTQRLHRVFFFTNIEIRIYCIKYEVYHKRFSLFAMANDFYPTRLCPLDKAWR